MSTTGRALSQLPQHLQLDSAVTDEIINYGCSAVQGFFRSIALSVESSLQDTLRLVIFSNSEQSEVPTRGYLN